MAPKIMLSEAGRNELQAMLTWWRNLPVNTTGRPDVEQAPHGRPEVYLARAPAGGIPALGTVGTGTGSGTGEGLVDDIPGSAECQVYRISHDDPEEDAAVEIIGQLTRTVYNFSTTAIEEYAWVLAVRDKFGKWIAANGFGEVDVCALLQTLPGYDAGVVQVLGHDAGGDCMWYDTDTCE